MNRKLAILFLVFAISSVFTLTGSYQDEVLTATDDLPPYIGMSIPMV